MSISIKEVFHGKQRAEFWTTNNLSFFLGLMLTLFVSIGVYTFHPPLTQFDTQIKELKQSEQEIRAARSQLPLTVWRFCTARV